MKYSIKTFLGLLVTFAFLLSCAQAPQQIAEKTVVPPADIATQKAKDSTVRLVSKFGDAVSFSSGFFVDTDKIATNIHVVAQPGPVFAKLSDKETILAVEGVAAFDVKNNLVILKLSGEGTPLPIGDSDTVQSGESVSVIGYPDGKYKASTGTIDYRQKSDKWFEVKVSVSKESSGGPVLNSKGEVIGIAVGYGDDSGNYAIPSNALKALLAQSVPLESLVEWRKREVIRAEGHHSQGEQKYAAKDYKNAIVAFGKAITLNPEHVPAYYKRARAKYYINDYAGAIDDCTHAIKLNPEHARAYNNRGGTKFRIEDYSGAIDDYTHAIKIDPEDAGLYSNRGGARIKFGESKFNGGDAEKAQYLYQEAIEDCTQAIKIEPGNYGAYRNRGIAAAALGDVESESGNASKIKSLYQGGITDYYKSIQLKNSEDADVPIAPIEFQEGNASTVHVAGWTSVSSGFFTGSGFFVDTDKIATNIHVVARPGPVFAKLKDEETIWEVVDVTAFDVENDLVVLKISGEGTPLPLGDSDTIQIGESIVTVGYPAGKYKVTKGKVHNIRNNDKWLLTTANTSSGGSGAPMLNSKDEVIGINAQSGNYGRAIPSNTLKALLARSELTESLEEWQERELIQAYAYFVQGHIKHTQKDYEGAITDLDAAIQLSPEFALAYYERANVYESRKNLKAAIVNYDKAIELGPEDAIIYQNRGYLKHDLGVAKAGKSRKLAKAQKFFQEAIDDYTHAIRIDPKFTHAYFNRGLTKHDLGESKEEQGNVIEAEKLYHAAIDDYTHAIKLNPDDADTFYNRGLTKHDLGESKEEQGNVIEAEKLYHAAIDDYTHAIKLNPDDAGTFHNRGVAKHDLGNSKAEQGNVTEAQQFYQTAIDDYTDAIKINPKYVLAYFWRGKTKKALRQHEAAKKDFKKARELESDQ